MDDPRPNAPTILVVDDEDVVRSTTARILARAGYAVSEAATAAEALARCESSEPFNLVLSDVVMPGQSGYDLARSIRVRSPRTAIILISGYTPTAMARHGLETDSCRLIHKPVPRAELLDLVEQLVGP